MLCALLFSGVLASIQSMPGLLAGSAVPVLLIFAGSVRELTKALLHVNAVAVFMVILLPLTTPGPVTSGLRLALLIVCKLNLISVVMVRMIVPLGVGRLDNVLADFRIPEKMRVLLLLTARYTLLLMARAAVMTRALRLRAPDLRGGRLYSAFACMLGTTLIHSSDRAERSMLAMRCRGGMAGFSQRRPMTWRLRDTLLCVFFAVNAVLIAAISLSFIR
ncbi:MAG: energy-coupling factor transporter transmembrane protein EcfT [Synergistaceae bacterium]|nr:energy-coupling factor transporter transmembrane protein EcfT [Synergistaceae bacterium]